MKFTEQKDLYPNTYKLIKEFSLDGYRSLIKLSAIDTFEVVGTWLNEIMINYPSDKFLDVLQNEHIEKLFNHFFTSHTFDYSFKRDLLVLVSQEFEMLFNELFDEAHDANIHDLIDEYPSLCVI